MSLISRMRRQKAVLWAQGSQKPDDYGNPTTGNAVEIACRWEEKSEKFINFNGEEEVSKSVVYVDRELKKGDLLRFGPLSSVTNPANARNNDGVWEVKGFASVPNLKCTENLLTAYL